MHKILSPEFGWINPLLINGNDKLGKGVYTFSILAGNALKHYIIDGRDYELLATCPCNCTGKRSAIKKERLWQWESVLQE